MSLTKTPMSSRLASLPALAAALVLAAGCKNSETPIPNTANHLVVVSGSNQTADVAAALAAPLVVEVQDGANRAVAGVPITWTVTGGGSVSAASGATDAQGRNSVTWTLGAAPGLQTATATTSAVPGGSAAFVAGNGPSITGVVTIGNADPASFFSAARAPSQRGSRAAATPRYSNAGVEVTFRSEAFRADAAGSPAYRSLDVARATQVKLQQRLTLITANLPVRDMRVSPAILTAHLAVTDTTAIDAVITALRADPSVASVTRDVIRGVRDGAPASQRADLSGVHVTGTSPYHPTGAATRLPNDPYYSIQQWGANMVGLPRAWAITTGSTGFSVAVVDMGIRFDHASVAANLTSDGYDFVSPTSLADLGYPSPATLCEGGTIADIDDDGTAGPDPDPTDPDDLKYDATNNCWQHSELGDHGLWTAGIIGAVGNDGQNLTGVEWSARIRPIRVLGVTGDGIGFDIAQGILYAAGLPAVGAGGALVTAPSRSPIINLSLGGSGVDPADSSAVAAAEQAGCLVVAAAGNSTSDTPFYPAAYAGVVGVSAVGMDGVIASYSNGGAYVSLAAPGGEYRLDDNGGDGILGPGWDFETGKPTYVFGYGTSGAAPYVSGAAALLLAHEPGLSASAIAARLEQFATRPSTAGRTDNYGWGIVNAYNALTQQQGPPRATYVRLLDASSGAVVRTVAADAAGRFTFTQLPAGSYQLQAGEDESADATIGIPGRRFAWAGASGTPTDLTTTAGSSAVQTVGIALGVPTEAEPNDATSTANPLSVGGYAVGQITPPDAADYYQVLIPTAGTYTFETSGVTGACGYGIELDTSLRLLGPSGAVVASNNDNGLASGPFCSTITAALTAGTYYVEVLPSTSGLADHGRYRLQVRAGS
jgi:hypothetical protein